MRKLFGVGLVILAAMTMPLAAKAAELPMKAPPAPPPPPAFSWTGCYIGGDVGGAWASGHLTDTLDGMNFGTSHSGVIGGPEVGCNYQTGPIVWGIEGNFDWTSIQATGSGFFVPGVGTLQGTANTDWIADVTGRIGWAAWNQVLLYFKGGGAWVRNTVTVTNLTTGASVSGENTNSGWLLGGGIEWAFAPQWSVKFEYDYIGLSNWNMNNNTVMLAGDTFQLSRNIQEAKVGLNWRFNWFNWGGGGYYGGTRY
ncbi:MAG TPA: outer membrane beta-barrel protein [Xanthobacteraceae bacterium]|nr:outer membrane beta-barrel protein [Xanthobacteraceae bacterium]